MPQVYILVKDMKNGHTDYQVWINKKKAHAHAATLRECYDVKDVRIHVGPIMDMSEWANENWR
jgi:hypothetical protein